MAAGAGTKVFVYDSGQNQLAIMSGGVYTVAKTPTQVRARTLQLNNLSGGVILSSGDVIKAVITHVGGLGPAGASGSVVFVGGVQGTDYPYINYGHLLSSGQSVTLEVSNFNKIAAVGSISGTFINFIGIQY